MRALVHLGALGGDSGRMLRAAQGLARRGHLVLWHGASAAAGDASAGDGHGPVHGEAPGPARADVVIGSSRAPLRTAWLGWKAGAHCMVLALEAGRVRRWGAIERLAC